MKEEIWTTPHFYFYFLCGEKKEDNILEGGDSIEEEINPR